jgi:hypothetical protein
LGERTVLTWKRSTRNMRGWTNKMDGRVREKKKEEIKTRNG